MKKILIVEDEEPIRRVLKRILADENPEFKISEAFDGNEAIEKLSRDKFDLVVCDIKMPKKDGLDVLKFANNKDIITPFIMLTGHGNIETAVEAMRIGAYDFIEKPPDLNRLLISIKNAFKIKNLQTENNRLKKRLIKKHEMIGNSTKFNNVLKLINKVAPTNARCKTAGRAEGKSRCNSGGIAEDESRARGGAVSFPPDWGTSDNEIRAATPSSEEARKDIEHTHTVNTSGKTGLVAVVAELRPKKFTRPEQCNDTNPTAR